MPAYFRRTAMNRQKQECSPRNPEEKQRHAPLTGHFEVYHQNFPVPGQKRRYQAASGTGCCSDHKQGRSAHSKGVFRLTARIFITASVFSLEVSIEKFFPMEAICFASAL